MDQDTINLLKNLLRFNSQWEHEVAKIILEILEHRDPLDLQEFTGEDMSDFYPRLKAIFGKTNRNIKNSANKALQKLRDWGSIEFLGPIPGSQYSRYRITNSFILEWLALTLEERRNIVKAAENKLK